MKHPEFIKKMDESGATLIPTTPAEFGKQIQQAMERYQRVSQMANIRNGLMPDGAFHPAGALGAGGAAGVRLAAQRHLVSRRLPPRRAARAAARAARTPTWRRCGKRCRRSAARCCRRISRAPTSTPTARWRTWTRSCFDEPWPAPLSPGEKSRLGFGLVWRNLRAGVPIYDRKLTVAEVQARIARYYQPYHAALAERIEDSAARFGGAWHLNLHSMPNDAYERLQIRSPHPLADFVLGDRDGTTCEPAFVDLIEREAARLRLHGGAQRSVQGRAADRAHRPAPRSTATACRSRSAGRSTWTRPRASATTASTPCATTSRSCCRRWPTTCASARRAEHRGGGPGVHWTPMAPPPVLPSLPLSRRRRFITRLHHCGPPEANCHLPGLRTSGDPLDSFPSPSVPACSTRCAATTATASCSDLGAGVTVGIVALPLAMAFAIASGLKPEAGLWTAIIAGFLIAAAGRLGGADRRPGRRLHRHRLRHRRALRRGQPADRHRLRRRAAVRCWACCGWARWCATCR